MRGGVGAPDRAPRPLSLAHRDDGLDQGAGTARALFAQLAVERGDAIVEAHQADHCATWAPKHARTAAAPRARRALAAYTAATSFSAYSGKPTSRISLATISASYGMRPDAGVALVQHGEPAARVAVLGRAHGAAVDEHHAAVLAHSRLVGVGEGEYVGLFGAGEALVPPGGFVRTGTR
jgi:hypothetical protein